MTQQPKITRSLNAKLQAIYCVLLTIADYLEDVPFEHELKEHVENFIEKVRELDDRVFNPVQDDKTRVELMDQQWAIQVSFRDWMIQHFELAQKDLPKIKR